MWEERQLIDHLRGVGLKRNDLVFTHSSLKKLGPINGGAETLINALISTVGPEGTVAVPTHTWEVVNQKQPVFHQKLTPSNVGTLTNIFRSRPDAIRSLHPTHSVAAIGPLASAFVEGHENDDTPCSETSPYGKLREWNGQILIIGEELNCCTYFHGCEQWAGLPKAVALDAYKLYSITSEGETIPVMHRTHIVNTWDQYPLLEPQLVAIGALNITSIGECSLRLLDAKKAADWLVPLLQKDPSIIYAESEA